MSTTLTPIQTQAIALLATGLSITAAAQHLNIDRTTIHTWKRLDPDFNDALRDAQEDAAAQTRAAYQQDVADARLVLRLLMLDPKTPASVRLKAALHILAKAEPPAPKPETRDERRDKRLLRHGVDPRFEADTYTEFIQQKKAEEAEARLLIEEAAKEYYAEPAHQSDSSESDTSATPGEPILQLTPQLLAEYHEWAARQPQSGNIQHNSSPNAEKDPKPQAA